MLRSLLNICMILLIFIRFFIIIFAWLGLLYFVNLSFLCIFLLVLCRNVLKLFFLRLNLFNLWLISFFLLLFWLLQRNLFDIFLQFCFRNDSFVDSISYHFFRLNLNLLNNRSFFVILRMQNLLLCNSRLLIYVLSLIF